MHAFPHESFIEDVRRLLEDYMRQARSWNFSANTWGRDGCTHLCTYRRHEMLYCEALLHKQKIDLSGLSKFREYVNVCNIFWTGFQIWMWLVTQRKWHFNSWGQSVHGIGVSLCTLFTWKMIQQTSIIIQCGQLKFEKQTQKNIIQLLVVLFWTHNADQHQVLLWAFNNHTMLGISIHLDLSKKMSSGGWDTSKTNNKWKHKHVRLLPHESFFSQDFFSFLPGVVLKLLMKCRLQEPVYDFLYIDWLQGSLSNWPYGGKEILEMAHLTILVCALVPVSKAIMLVT